MEIRKENCGNFNARDSEEDRFFPFFSFHFSPRNVSDLTYLTEFITVCMKEKQRSNVHVVIYV